MSFMQISGFDMQLPTSSYSISACSPCFILCIVLCGGESVSLGVKGGGNSSPNLPLFIKISILPLVCAQILYICICVCVCTRMNTQAIQKQEQPKTSCYPNVYKQINLYSGKDKMVIHLAQSKSKSPSLLHPPEDAPHPSTGREPLAPKSSLLCLTRCCPVPPNSRSSLWGHESLQSSSGLGRCPATLHTSPSVLIAMEKASC